MTVKNAEIHLQHRDSGASLGVVEVAAGYKPEDIQNAIANGTLLVVDHPKDKKPTRVKAEDPAPEE